MKILHGFTKYLIIFSAGICLAFLGAYMQYNSNDFSASILSLTEQDFFENTQRDAGYKKENQIFELFLADQIRNEGNLTVSILYSPEIEIFLYDATKNCQIEIVERNHDNGNLLLNISGYENLDSSEGIFQIPYSGESKDLTLEYVKSEDKIFAIGNLDNIESQTH